MFNILIQRENTDDDNFLSHRMNYNTAAPFRFDLGTKGEQ